MLAPLVAVLGLQSGLGAAQKPRVTPPRVWLQQGVAMWGAAAILGPLCDGCHSKHDVLHYAVDSIAGDPWVLRAPGGDVLLETCWWVPIAFGGAGVILGATHPLFDRREAASEGKTPRAPPGWGTTLLVIASFVLCYELSGVLAQAAAASPPTSLVERVARLDGPLTAAALAIYLVFERSPGGLFMALLTATIGPVVEIGLINVGGLYAYTHADVASIPLWIPQVYFAGAPAVGALGRQVLHELEQRDGVR